MNFHQPPAAHVEHVIINVSDLEKSLDYYKETIGFKVLSRESKKADLTADGKTAILSLVEPDNPVAKQRTTGLFHFAILLPDRASFASLVLYLANEKVRLGASDHDVSEALYLNDPDGNGIEIYRDRDSSEWTWNQGQVKMVTEQLDVDDVMRGYDPDRPWEGMPENTKMGHLHLHVADLDDTLSFYTEGLGLTNVLDFGGQAAFLSFENYHHHIAINVWNGINAPAPPENSVGLNHYLLRYPDDAAVSDAVARLKSMNHTVSEEDGGYTSVDPSGNKVLMTS